MPELLLMPEIAANTTAATLTEWPVPENQPYSANDVIATVETEKAGVDIEAESDGTIVRTLVAPGTDVAVGQAIALLAMPGETVEDVDAALVALGVHLAAAADPAGPSGPAAAAAAAAEPGADPAPSRGPGARTPFSSPLARRLARDAGLTLDEITGTGPRGRVVRKDVELAAAARAASTAAPVAPVPPPPDAPPAREVAPAPAYVDVPPARLRRKIAERLTESKQTIPHFYVGGSARVDDLLALRAELNEHSPVKISVNDLVVKAVACAHRLVPAVNVLWTADAIRTPSTVDLAVAIATESGLVTPVLREVDRMSVATVAATTRDFVHRARDRRLRPHELEGGTSTITNLGMFGTSDFSAIINPPQSTILAVGAATRQPVVDAAGELRPASVMRVTLSVDHRPIDGSVAAEWMRHLIAVLEEPLRILL